jgi:hypothetical protein
MFCWCKIRLVQFLLNLFGHRFIGSGGRGGGKIGDEVGQGLLSRVSVRWTLYPVHKVVRFLPRWASGTHQRADEQRSGRKISSFSPSELPIFFKEVVLDPDPMQDLNGRNLPQPIEIGCLEAGSRFQV